VRRTAWVVALAPALLLGAHAAAAPPACCQWSGSALVQVDHARFDGVHTRDGNAAAVSWLRRAEFGAQAQWSRAWRAAASVSIDGDGQARLSSAHLGWSPSPGLLLRAGRVDPDFGLEPSTGSGRTFGIERSAIWDLAPDAASVRGGLGLRVDGHGRGWQGETLWALEAAWQQGPATLQAEALWRQQDAAGAPDRDSHGLTLLAAWTLHGGARRHDPRRARFGAPGAAGDWGHWEVFARTDTLAVRGGYGARVQTLGLAWSDARVWRVAFEMLAAQANDANRAGDHAGRALALRVQAAF
jgi:phosphate-selective porin